MPKWKIQAVEPHTCDPFTEEVPATYDAEALAFFALLGEIPPATKIVKANGCRYYELWNSLSPPPLTPVVVCAVIRVCPAHAVPALVPAPGGRVDKPLIKWADGNWKDEKAYIKYQRDWFRWVNHREWLIRAPRDGFGDLQPMPPQISKFTTEPVTPGSVTAPSQDRQDGIDQVYTWNREHNDRMGTTLAVMRNELGMVTEEQLNQFDKAVTWRFEGHGDTRLFFVNSGGLLSNQEKIRIEATTDIQFGPGKVVVEG